MIKYTNQTAFDTSAAGLLNQNCKSESFHIGCAYRGPNDTKCGIGFLIDDDQYTGLVNVEGQLVAALRQRGQVPQLDDVNMGLLERIQAVHDERVVEEWLVELRLIAHEFKLEWNHEN